MAALAGLTLDHVLRTHRRQSAARELAGLTRRAHHDLARTASTIWLMATGEDSRYPTTEGASRTLSTRLMHRYLSRVGRVMTGNHTVNAAFLDVANLVRPPTALFHPGVLIPTLRGKTRALPTPPTSAPTSAWPDAIHRGQAAIGRKASGPQRSSSP